MTYRCKNCGHASGYHKDMGYYFGSCRITKCKCETFVWDKEDYERYLYKRLTQSAEKENK